MKLKDHAVIGFGRIFGAMLLLVGSTIPALFPGTGMAQDSKPLSTIPCLQMVTSSRICSDTIQTSAGDIRITPIYHASVLLEFGGKVIYVDPVTRMRGPSGLKMDLSDLPKADLILISDIHEDHMDRLGIDEIKKPSTIVVAPRAVAITITEAQQMKNGETKTIAGFNIEAIPMYNLVRGPRPGELFHDKGRGNGYILTLGGKRLYFSGDAECIPEMKTLKNIDIAFMAMNGRQTMTPAECAQCVTAFRPKILYPYHFGDSGLEELADLVRAGAPEVEVRVRKWY
jgi:L-ascorbate metabolism protein UlaG (beta-lactamase superfamily)